MSPSDFVTRGQALVSSGQYQEAVKVCRLGLLGKPTAVDGRVVLGQALLALKRYDEVLAEMRVALELEPGSQPALVLKAEAMVRKGDGHGALEILGPLRGQGDAHVTELMTEAERLASRAAPPPAAGFLVPPEPDAFGAEAGTKHYPGQEAALAEGFGEGGGGGEYTRPTTIAPPRRRSTVEPLRSAPERRDGTPPPAVLAVGDRSGTVEVDKDLQAPTRRVRGEDLDDVVAPPTVRGRGLGGRVDARRQAPAVARPTVAPATVAGKKARRSVPKQETSTVELEDDEVILLEDERATESAGRGGRKQGGTAVRHAVSLPSGPIDEPPSVAARARSISTAPPPVSLPGVSPRSASGAAMPLQPMVPLRGVSLAGLPLPPPAPLPPPPLAPQMPSQMSPHQMSPAMALGPTLPAMNPPVVPSAAMQPPPHLQQTMLAPGMAPGMPPPRSPGMAGMMHPSAMAAAQPTISADPQAARSPFAPPGPAPSWAREVAMPAAAFPDDSPPRPLRSPLMDGSQVLDGVRMQQPSEGLAYAGMASEPSVARAAMPGRPSRAPRKARSPLQVALWFLIGAAVIGGGVFAGFQIRALRLSHQIAAARDRANDLAKGDTWQGWIGARDGLLSIAQASPTGDNRAALARARGVLAFEFGDGLADARASVESLGTLRGLDREIAAAYVGLAQRDPRAAQPAADRAIKEAASDPAALYVAGQAALLSGDIKAAVVALRGAVEHEPRPNYVVALAQALGQSALWDEAITAVDRVRDNPGALITRAVLLSVAGRITGTTGGELRAQLTKLIGDGQRPDGPSRSQVAFAQLALARVDFARGDRAAATRDYLAALAADLDDQRFAEELADTALAVGDLEPARKIAIRASERWPGSFRVRTTLARIWLAVSTPASAIDVFTRSPDTATWPPGQTVRGQARIATGELDGARADFDAALKKLPGFEPAVIARIWLDLAANDVEAARKRIDPKLVSKVPSPAMAAVVAETQRLGGDAAALDKARALLERVIRASPGADTARAWLELGRIARDQGDFKAANTAYEAASGAGDLDARREYGALLIETGEPRRARDMLDQLLKAVGERPPFVLLIEAARARALVGDHRGAMQLLVFADRGRGPQRWQIDRERGRIALRKGDIAGAAQYLDRALDGCGDDIDSFLLAADTLAYDDKQAALGQKLRTLLPTRLKGKPEIDIIAGKIHIAANQFAEAEKDYTTAHDALVKAKASNRRLAQADFGLGAVAYFGHDDAGALSRLKLVVYEDPSIDAAYLFAAELDRAKDPARALETARTAVTFNPDSVEAWKLIGTIAATVPRQRKLLDEAITRVGALVPGSDALRQLQRLR